MSLGAFVGFQAKERGALQFSFGPTPAPSVEVSVRLMHVAEHVQQEAVTRCDLTLELLPGFRIEPLRRMMSHQHINMMRYRPFDRIFRARCMDLAWVEIKQLALDDSLAELQEG